jgi:capsule polysaccharide export protein KpsE/RkpR
VNYTSSAPTRQVEPEVPDADIVASPVESDAGKGTEQTLAHLQLLWRNRALLLKFGLCALLASTLVAFLIPPRYESTARLMPPDNQSASGLAAAAAALTAGAGGLSSLAGDYLGLKSTSDVFVGVLTSRTVQDKLIQQFDLKKLYWDRRMEDARADLAERTSISIERKSQIITIAVTDRSPLRAAAMTQAYVEELNRLVAELSTSSARRERIFLESRLQDVSQELETAEKEFSQFSSKNAAIDIKEQGRAMVEAAATLQGQLIAAQSQLEGLRQIYADNNVRVRSVRARIDELERQLEKIGGKGESTSSLASQPGDSMYPSIRKLPLLGVEYADLYRRTKVQEAVFETLTKEYELAKVQEAKEIPTVKVLDSANIPERKSFPPRLAIMYFGTALGLVVAAAWVLGNEKWQRTDAADPRKMFAQEVLSDVADHMPRFSQNGSGERLTNGSVWTWRHRRKREGVGRDVNDAPDSK